MCAAFIGPGSAAVPSLSKSSATEQPGSFAKRLTEGEYTTSVQDGIANVKKAKLQFDLPTLYFRGIFKFCTKYPSEPAGPSYCPPEFRQTVPDKYKTPSSKSLQGGSLEYYLARRQGSKLIYGSVAGIRVKTLAFGAVPVEATVHLSQRVVNGFVDPLRAQATLLVQLGAIDAGTPSWPGFPPVPADAQDGIGYVLRSDFSALLDVRLSDVTVDGRPLNVGANCKTARPSSFSVVEPRGIFPGGFDSPRVRGLPSGFKVTIDPVGTFDGTIDIPAFAGCGTDGDDLDPLVTSLVSGPGNRVSGLIPRTPITNLWCEQPIADCSSSQRAGEKRMTAFIRAVQNKESPATIKKLRARLQPSDYVSPRVPASKR